MEHISIQSTVIFHLGPLAVTNTVISAWVTIVVLGLLSYFATRRIKLVPSGLQNLMEYVVELLLTVCESTAGRRGRTFFPIVATAFLFILVNNWTGLLPLYGDVPWLRSANSDLNLTVAMALIVFVLVQGWAIAVQGPRRYLKEFVVPNPLHILSEISRPVSLAFRLFGNIFAGEVVIATITGLFGLVLPMVFYGFEIFVGILQAIIFSMLTLVFLTMGTLHHGAENHPEDGSHA